MTKLKIAKPSNVWDFGIRASGGPGVKGTARDQITSQFGFAQNGVKNTGSKMILLNISPSAISWTRSLLPVILVASLLSIPEAATSTCVIENGIDYYGYNLNGLNGQSSWDKKSDGETCQCFCKHHYPTAPFFTFITTSMSYSLYHYTCWCRSSDAGRKTLSGAISGDVDCGGNQSKHR